MKRRHWWVIGVAVVGTLASIAAAVLLWLILTKPTAIAQAFGLAL